MKPSDTYHRAEATTEPIRFGWRGRLLLDDNLLRRCLLTLWPCIWIIRLRWLGLVSSLGRPIIDGLILCWRAVMI